jgi:RHH-type rel operon transcriptional repressor/antitoxin RelB
MAERYLEDMEDYYAAVEISERIRRGEEKVYSSAEIRRELGLDD